MGIPLFIVMTASIGSTTFRLFKKLQRYCLAEGKSERDEKLAAGRRLGSSMFYITFGVGIFVVVPGLVFSFVENWSYSEGLYCAIITLATIGLGDYVPGRKLFKTFRRSLHVRLTYMT